eukprot:2962358-Pyramimonas_sp.AAC.1
MEVCERMYISSPSALTTGRRWHRFLARHVMASPTVWSTLNANDRLCESSLRAFAPNRAHQFYRMQEGYSATHNNVASCTDATIRFQTIRHAIPCSHAPVRLRYRTCSRRPGGDESPQVNTAQCSRKAACSIYQLK